MRTWYRPAGALLLAGLMASIPGCVRSQATVSRNAPLPPSPTSVVAQEPSQAESPTTASVPVLNNIAESTAAEPSNPPHVAIPPDKVAEPPAASAARQLPDEKAWPDPFPLDSAASEVKEATPRPLPDNEPLEKHGSEVRLVSQGSVSTLCPTAEGEVLQLVLALESSDVATVKRAIHQLGRLGGEAEAATPALRDLLKHPREFVQVYAALALCRIQGTARESLPTLVAGLKSQDAGVRSFSAAVLRESGPASAEAIPALQQALSDPDPYVRLHVAEALVRFDDWSNKATATLLDCLQSPEENVRWLTTYSLAEIAPQRPEVVTALVQRLSDPAARVRIGAVYALGKIGPLAKPAVSQLATIRNSSRGELRTAANYALQQITQNDE